VGPENRGKGTGSRSQGKGGRSEGGLGKWMDPVRRLYGLKGEEPITDQKRGDFKERLGGKKGVRESPSGASARGLQIFIQQQQLMNIRGALKKKRLERTTDMVAQKVRRSAGGPSKLAGSGGLISSRNLSK